MSEIDDLLSALAPNGVGHVRLGDIARTVPGLSGKSKSDFSDGNARYVTYMNVFSNLAVVTNASDFVKIGPGEKQSRLHAADVVFTGSSESLEEVGMSSVVTSEPTEPLYLNSFCFAVRFNDPTLLLPAFSKYLFRSASVRTQIKRAARGVTRINISKAQFMGIQIPVPPMEVQSRIASTLDRLTDLMAELEANLEAELEARLRQHAFYRSESLTFAADPSVRRVTLADVCTRVSSGATPRTGRSDYYENGDIPWLRTQEVVWRDIVDTDVKITAKAVKETAANWVPANCVIVAISGASAARAAVNKIPLTTNQHCCNLEIDPLQANYRYVFQWVSANYERLKALGHGARSDLNGGLIKSFPIDVPSLEVQERIAGFLDSLETLVKSISKELPTEITARRKQYEYYHDKLLTFEQAAP